MNVLRWHLKKYTLLGTDGNQPQQHSKPLMVVESNSPGDLQFHLFMSNRLCSVSFEGRTLEDIVLEGPGAPVLKRKGFDVLFTSLQPTFNQRKFRIKFAASGGNSALEQCSDCVSYLRHYLKIELVESGSVISWETTTNSSSDATQISLSQQQQLSQEVVGEPAVRLMSQNSTFDDFSQPVSSSQESKRDIFVSGSELCSQEPMDLSVDMLTGEYERKNDRVPPRFSFSQPTLERRRDSLRFVPPYPNQGYSMQSLSQPVLSRTFNSEPDDSVFGTAVEDQVPHGITGITAVKVEFVDQEVQTEDEISVELESMDEAELTAYVIQALKHPEFGGLMNRIEKIFSEVDMVAKGPHN